jgi:hypothetical protein
MYLQLTCERGADIWCLSPAGGKSERLKVFGEQRPLNAKREAKEEIIVVPRVAAPNHRNVPCLVATCHQCNHFDHVGCDWAANIFGVAPVPCRIRTIPASGRHVDEAAAIRPISSPSKAETT